MKYRIKSNAWGNIGDCINYQVQYYKVGWIFKGWVNIGKPYYYLQQAKNCIDLLKNEIEH